MNRDFLSLSFLDLLTCGMGGMLMLFLILLVVRPEIGKGRGTGNKSKGQTESPFAVIVELESTDTLSHSDLPRKSWEIDGSSPWKPTSKEIGKDYALMYAKSAPPKGLSIQLTGLSNDATGVVRIILRNKVHRFVNIAPNTTMNGSICVWPLQESAP